MSQTYLIQRPDELISPSLLVFVALVQKNLDSMIQVAGGASRLRPHVKTHKMPAIVRMAEAMGIRKHKCATIAEAEMLARTDAHDVLIAYPTVGPNVQRLAQLVEAYPRTTFRATVDNPRSLRKLSLALYLAEMPLPVLVDLDIGMGRTGIPPGDEAAELYEMVADLPNVVPDGLHAYDGQIRDTDPEARRQAAAPGIKLVHDFRERLIASGLPVPRLVLGGTPTFPIHAEDTTPGVECSPGTCVLHDAGYGSKFPDLPFTPAAVLLTRVVSQPRAGRLCLDVGHKAVAADPVGPRLVLLDLPGFSIEGQSEEHLVVDVDRPGEVATGSHLLAIPTHICPTCALHSWAYAIADGEVVDRWEVKARDRVLSI